MPLLYISCSDSKFGRDLVQGREAGTLEPRPVTGGAGGTAGSEKENF
jgi:hypothetical protein